MGEGLDGEAEASKLRRPPKVHIQAFFRQHINRFRFRFGMDRHEPLRARAVEPIGVPEVKVKARVVKERVNGLPFHFLAHIGDAQNISILGQWRQGQRQGRDATVKHVGGLQDGARAGVGRRTQERHDGEAVVTAGKGVSGVYVSVAGGAEGGRIGPASDGGGRLLADLAKADALVPRGQLVRSVDLLVADEAEEGRVCPAEKGRRRSLAGVAAPRRDAPSRTAGRALSTESHLSLSRLWEVAVIKHCVCMNVPGRVYVSNPVRCTKIRAQRIETCHVESSEPRKGFSEKLLVGTPRE